MNARPHAVHRVFPNRTVGDRADVEVSKRFFLMGILTVLTAGCTLGERSSGLRRAYQAPVRYILVSWLKAEKQKTPFTMRRWRPEQVIISRPARE
jgi:hypothetical protein